jgi:hypothetical protein
MICFIPFVRLSFSYWVLRRVIRYTLFRLRAHDGCDRSAEDAYSSKAPDSTSGVTRGPCKPGFDCESFRLTELDADIDCRLFRLNDVEILIFTADCPCNDHDSAILKWDS